MKSEKTALVKAVKEAKAAKDEAITTAASLRTEQERLIRVAKEADEKVVLANSEKDQVVGALEEERVVFVLREKAVREEVGLQIIKYGMTFRRSALFMVKEKYLDLDFSDINFSDIKGHEENPPVPVNAAPVQLVEEALQVEGVVEVEGAQGDLSG